MLKKTNPLSILTIYRPYPAFVKIISTFVRYNHLTMNSKLVRTLAAGLTATLILTGCDGLGKMIKKQKEFKYTVTPNPIEMHGDSVQFSASGKFNPKLFQKKVTLTLTPVIKYANGGEKSLKPVVLVGEKSTGSGQKISYSSGGSFNYTSEKFPFEEGMRNSKVEIRGEGQVKTKKKAFEPVVLADGTMATSLLARNDEKPMMAKDNFQKSAPANQTTHIYYVINRSEVRASEMKSEENKTFNTFMTDNTGSPWYNFKGINVSAYASPDGETDKNENLAKDRANSAIAAMVNSFKGIKPKDKNIKSEFGKNKDQYQIVVTREDWEGFRQLMEQSTMADKDLILRVLTMYTDPDQRRKEIKNLSKTYEELANNVLPKLRRAEIIANIEKMSRRDDQISRLATTNPDSLSVEELLYGANLTNDVNTKVQIYQAAEKQYGNDWRTSNNLGCALLMQNKLNEAGDAFRRAEKAAASEPAVYNNLGIVEARNGNRAAAMERYKKAGGSTEAKYNMGILQIRMGQYSDAANNLSGFKGHNLALAQLMSGNPGAVNETINASPEKDAAHSAYLKAVAFARQGNTSEAITNLKAAVEKDNAWKAYAKDDAEFIKMRSDAGFTSIVQ
jgi:tetratricopeptide (TPR) repeat protein